MTTQLKDIFNQFVTLGELSEIAPFGDGLINSTFKATTKAVSSPDYLLQKINHQIFKDVGGLTSNIIRICNHLRGKINHLSEHEQFRRVLTPILTKDGKGYYKDGEGNYWRMFYFINNTFSYNKLTSSRQSYLGGKAFGQFHKLMADLPGEPLVEVLPGFHNTEMRIENFKKRVELNPVNRLLQVKHEVDYLMERADEYGKIVRMGREGVLPQRIVHQDTKINNVLFDKDDNILCVIDLDTVMPGYVCYDIGDAIRNGANTGMEDDPNLDNVSMDIELYEGFIHGFIEEARSFLTKAEIDTLAFGAKLLTYEQAVRFLDDYIDGDNYYRIQYPEHNLVRARAQIKLLHSMEEQFVRMEEIVKNYA